MEISKVLNPSSSPLRPSKVPCSPLPIISMNMPNSRAQELLIT